MLFFLFFLIIYLYVLLPTAVVQIFNPFAEVKIPIGIPTKEAQEKMEPHPVTSQVKTSLG